MLIPFSTYISIPVACSMPSTLNHYLPFPRRHLNSQHHTSRFPCLNQSPEMPHPHAKPLAQPFCSTANYHTYFPLNSPLAHPQSHLHTHPHSQPPSPTQYLEGVVMGNSPPKHDNFYDLPQFNYILIIMPIAF